MKDTEEFNEAIEPDSENFELDGELDESVFDNLRPEEYYADPESSLPDDNTSMVICPSCNGTCTEMGEPCPGCDGDGQVIDETDRELDVDPEQDNTWT